VPFISSCSFHFDQVEQLQFGNDEKSVMVKTVDGATQIAAVLPTAQVSSFVLIHFAIISF